MPSPAADKAFDRKPGWTEGRPLILAGGSTWHLPRVDDSIIPLLPRIVGNASDLGEELDGYLRGDDRPDEGLGPRVGVFVWSVLIHQYRWSPEDMHRFLDLRDPDEIGDLVNRVDRFITDLIDFNDRRTAFFTDVPAITN